jgi:hypothetical protein
LLLLFLLLLFFLIPLAAYCLVLAGINRRLHPLLVPGTWDCIGLLCAVSGFLLAVVPGLVSQIFSDRLRELAFVDPHAGLKGAGIVLDDWWGVLLAYYLLLIVAAAGLVFIRRTKTVIYNITADGWETALATVVQQLGLKQVRMGSWITLVPFPDKHQGEATGAQVQALVAADALKLRADVFPALSNVTLDWKENSTAARAHFERELAGALREIETEENAAASWFLGIGGAIFSVLLLSVAFLLLVVLSRRW